MEHVELVGLPFSCPWRDTSANTAKGLDYWTEEHKCSFCGSLSPERVLDLIAEGAVVTPTDKGMKMYIANKVVYFNHFSQKNIEDFVALLKSGKVGFDSPGRFYVLPYFLEV